MEAQYDYATEDRNRNGIPEYARKLISSPGRRDGLYWPGSDAPPTRFAAGVQKAQAEGYRKEGEAAVPYHGYYFRVLLAQGPNARGGDRSFEPCWQAENWPGRFPRCPQVMLHAT